MGWWFLRPGNIVNAVEKCMGLKKGEKVERICQIGILNTRPVILSEISKADLILEGFPDLTTDEFIEMFCKSHKKCVPVTAVNRIEFRYI